MARIVKNTDNTIVTCKIITAFKDGTKSTKEVKVGDVIEGLRYVANSEVISVTGKIKQIVTEVKRTTPVSLTKPVDYFKQDVIVKTLVIDASEQYESKIYNVPAMEIVEDEGVMDVQRMFIESYGYETMDMEYTDGSVVNQNLEIGDVLENVVIMNGPGKPDTTGTFKVVAWDYRGKNNVPDVTGVFLMPITGGTAVRASFNNFISFDEATHDVVDDDSSLGSIAGALEESDVVYASLGVDVEIPKRDDGKITTLFIDEGKTLNMDLNGHNLDCQAYAFYVNGGTLNISDTSGTGSIKCHQGESKAYPAVFVGNNGTCNMTSGIIDTTEVDLQPGEENWLYGVVCSGNGVFNMTGGSMKIYGAAGISITNGTASGEGAKFTIGGNSVIESVICSAIYLADNKSVTIKDNAKIKGSIVVRMGDISVEDKATVESHPAGTETAPLGTQVCLSGVDSTSAAVLALTGCYGSDLGNDLNINVSKTAKVSSYTGDAFDVAMIDTKFDQKVVINVEDKVSLKSLNDNWRVFDHDELAEMARECGKTLPAKGSSTDLTINIAGKQEYPVID